MTTAKLKENLINSIRNTDKEFILEEIKLLLDFELDTEVYAFNAEQKEAIKEAEEDIINGRVISDEEANQRFNKWLEE
ncbi:hypothetical protein [Flavobacterium subsaxonicum]|uniref:Addiction module protein n=1 Tax=Flavobacterium subsaxonicum WB 4.1-42 = DSM 21790 TaxID=1121898 RepID=A0A0A2MG68_9FLAO|nr:hypothetical protein [Flavobacterium subsaxonicum]KGO91264.1 hypothetical protein Q766_19095 [Flavobacterium subsaxonicum WB 4.1-42 = DSM 21790]